MRPSLLGCCCLAPGLQPSQRPLSYCRLKPSPSTLNATVPLPQPLPSTRSQIFLTWLWFAWVFKSVINTHHTLKRLPYMQTRYRQLCFRFYVLMYGFMHVLYHVMFSIYDFFHKRSILMPLTREVPWNVSFLAQGRDMAVVGGYVVVVMGGYGTSRSDLTPFGCA